MDNATIGYAAGVTAAVIAWGYLVYMAIDFGSAARSGSGAAWFLLILAALGAVACLFAGLMLATRLMTALGLVSDDPDDDSKPPRPPGGRRAAR